MSTCETVSTHNRRMCMKVQTCVDLQLRLVWVLSLQVWTECVMSAILTHAPARVRWCTLCWVRCLQLKRSFWTGYTWCPAQQDLKSSRNRRHFQGRAECLGRCRIVICFNLLSSESLRRSRRWLNFFICPDFLLSLPTSVKPFGSCVCYEQSDRQKIQIKLVISLLECHTN